MPFDDLNESTIFEMTKDSREESDDDDMPYMPSMNLKDHCYEEHMNDISEAILYVGKKMLLFARNIT